MGIPPRHGSHAAPPIACDALNASDWLGKEVSYSACRRPQAATPEPFRRGVGRSAVRVGISRPDSVMAHPPYGSSTQRNVSDLPMLRRHGAIPCAAFFFKVQNGCKAHISSGTERVRKLSAAAVVYSSVLKVRTAIIGPLFGSFVPECRGLRQEMGVPALVVQLPHGEAGSR